MPATTDDAAHKAEFEFIPFASWPGLRARGKSYLRGATVAVVAFPVLFAGVGGFLTGSAAPAMVVVITLPVAAFLAVAAGAGVASLLGVLDTPERPLKHRIASFRAELATKHPAPATVHVTGRPTSGVDVTATHTHPNIKGWSPCERSDCMEDFARETRRKDAGSDGP